MMELAKVYGFGELKYDRFNYLKGYPWSLSIDALLRHLLSFMAGEDRDLCTAHPNLPPIHDWIKADEATGEPGCDGSGLLHSAHIAWHALALTAFAQRGIGTDDREPRTDLNVTPSETFDWPGLLNRMVTYRGMPMSDWKSYVTETRIGDCFNVDSPDCGQPHCKVHGFQP
jgi:hypothetical protein